MAEDSFQRCKKEEREEANTCNSTSGGTLQPTKENSFFGFPPRIPPTPPTYRYATGTSGTAPSAMTALSSSRKGTEELSSLLSPRSVRRQQQQMQDDLWSPGSLEGEPTHPVADHTVGTAQTQRSRGDVCPQLRLPLHSGEKIFALGGDQIHWKRGTSRRSTAGTGASSGSSSERRARAPSELSELSLATSCATVASTQTLRRYPQFQAQLSSSYRQQRQRDSFKRPSLTLESQTARSMVGGGSSSKSAPRRQKQEGEGREIEARGEREISTSGSELYPQSRKPSLPVPIFGSGPPDQLDRYHHPPKEEQKETLRTGPGPGDDDEEAAAGESGDDDSELLLLGDPPCPATMLMNEVISSRNKQLDDLFPYFHKTQAEVWEETADLGQFMISPEPTGTDGKKGLPLGLTLRTSEALREGEKKMLRPTADQQEETEQRGKLSSRRRRSSVGARSSSPLAGSPVKSTSIGSPTGRGGGDIPSPGTDQSTGKEIRRQQEVAFSTGMRPKAQPQEDTVPAVFKRLHVPPPKPQDNFRPLTTEFGNNRGDMRRGIHRKLDELRTDEQKYATFERQCARAIHERAQKVFDKFGKADIHKSLLAPHCPSAGHEEEKLQHVRDRREQRHLQQVMNPRPTVCVPKDLYAGHKDSLLHRRWAVLVVIPQLFELTIGGMIRQRFAPHRRIATCPLGMIFNLGDSFEYQRRRIASLRVIESAALRYALARRVRAKRRATVTIRLFLVMRAYIASIKAGVSTYRNQVIRCQRLVKKYFWRRERRLRRWLGMWRRIERDILHTGGFEGLLLSGVVGQFHPIVTTAWRDEIVELFTIFDPKDELAPAIVRSDGYLKYHVFLPLHRQLIQTLLLSYREYFSMMRSSLAISVRQQAAGRRVSTSSSSSTATSSSAGSCTSLIDDGNGNLSAGDQGEGGEREADETPVGSGETDEQEEEETTAVAGADTGSTQQELSSVHSSPVARQAPSYSDAESGASTGTGGGGGAPSTAGLSDGGAVKAKEIKKKQKSSSVTSNIAAREPQLRCIYQRELVGYVRRDLDKRQQLLQQRVAAGTVAGDASPNTVLPATSGATVIVISPSGFASRLSPALSTTAGGGTGSTAVAPHQHVHHGLQSQPSSAAHSPQTNSLMATPSVAGAQNIAAMPSSSSSSTMRGGGTSTGRSSDIPVKPSTTAIPFALPAVAAGGMATKLGAHLPPPPSAALPLRSPSKRTKG